MRLKDALPCLLRFIRTVTEFQRQARCRPVVQSVTKREVELCESP